MKKWFKKTMCLLLAGLALLSAGCVKTPEGEAVTAKTKIDGLHIGEVKSDDGTLTPQELGQPEHITESWTQALGDPDFGGVTGSHQKLDYTVNIDADVIVPAGGIFPVYGVSKAKYMDEDLFDRFVTVLFEGNEYVCYPPEGRVYEKGCFDVDGRYVGAEYSTGNAFYARMLTVHQGVDAFEVVGQDDSYREYLLFTETGSDAQMSGFCAGAEETNVIGQPDAIFDYFGSGEDVNAGKEDLPPKVLMLERNETSPEDALKLAEDFIDKVGLANSMTLAYSGRTRFSGRIRGQSYETMGFAFVPVVGDARMAPIDIADTVDTARLRYRNLAADMDFAALWLPNMLCVYVFNGRIFYVHWTSCTADNNEGVISRNAPLKPFSEIYETFKAKLDLLGNIPPISANYAVPAERKVNINNIELCYYRVKAGTGAEDYALVPVWVFMGNIEWKYDDPSESQLIAAPDGTVIQGGAGYCVMMINAIDGSVIDLTKGY